MNRQKINARIRKINSKIISTLNHSGLKNCRYAKDLKKENKLLK